MNRRKRLVLCAALAASALAASALARPAIAAEPAGGRTLRHDPFSRDMIRGLVQQATAAAAATAAAIPAAAPAAATPAAAEAAPARMPVLRAVLHGPSRSMVNVDGTLIEPGESVDGYRLVEIGDFGARFVKDGRPVELPLGSGSAP